MMSLEGDLVFTKRFVDCVKKPHSDRTPEVREVCVAGYLLSQVSGRCMAPDVYSLLPCDGGLYNYIIY